MQAKKEKQDYINEALAETGISNERFIQYLATNRRIVPL